MALKAQDIARFIRSLTEPNADIKDPDERARARLLGLMTLGSFSVQMVTLFVFALLGWLPIRNVEATPLSISIASMFITYTIWRRGHWRLAGFVLILFGGSILFIHVLITGQPAIGTLKYAILIVLFVAIIYSPRAALFATALCCGIIVLIPLVNRRIVFQLVVSQELTFVLVFSLLIIVAMWFREQLETERRMRLTVSETRYRMISEMMSDYAFGCFIRDGRVVVDWMTEDAFKRLSGYDWPHIERVGLRTVVHPDDVESMLAAIRPVLEGRPSENEFRLITANGTTRWINVIRTPITDPKTGKPHYFYGIGTDVTNYRMAEMDRIETERLKAEIEKERQLSEVKNKVMMTISHEFRTPLAQIRMATDLLEAHIDRMTPERRLDRLATIRNSISTLTDLIGEIAAMMQNAFNPLPLRLEPVQVHALVAEVVDKAQQRGESPGHTITFESNAQTASPVMIDVRQYTRAAENLVNNAIKYSPNGGDILVKLDVNPHQVMLSVKDSGIGIAEEDQSRLFTPFFRGRNSDQFPGTGFGLTIVKDCATMHGGTVQVQSVVGRGSTFTLSVPYREAPVTESSPQLTDQTR
jgi:PAS domain S-box-containing protein